MSDGSDMRGKQTFQLNVRALLHRGGGSRTTLTSRMGRCSAHPAAAALGIATGRSRKRKNDASASQYTNAGIVVSALEGTPIALFLIWAIATDLKRRRSNQALTDHNADKVARQTRIEAEGKGSSWGGGL